MANKKNIYLMLNEDQWLEIHNCNSQKEHICQYDELEIFFVDKGEKYKLYDNIILCDLDVFKEMLQKALNNKLLLDNSIQGSIGFIWNESLQEEEGSKQKYFDVINYYSLWSSGPYIEYSTWIYNKNGTNFLEISPDYRWHFIDPKPDDQYITYLQWRQDFKPIVIGEIDKKIIQEWINQIDGILLEMKDDQISHVQDE